MNPTWLVLETRSPKAAELQEARPVEFGHETLASATVMNTVASLCAGRGLPVLRCRQALTFPAAALPTVGNCRTRKRTLGERRVRPGLVLAALTPASHAPLWEGAGFGMALSGPDRERARAALANPDMRQAVLAQCQQLGVSPDESEDVLVLVVESLLADPLPGWQEERDSATGSAYWYNIETVRLSAASSPRLPRCRCHPRTPPQRRKSDLPDFRWDCEPAKAGVLNARLSLACRAKGARRKLGSVLLVPPPLRVFAPVRASSLPAQGESTWKNPVDEAYAERIQQLRARQSAAASAAGGGAAGSAQAGGSGASAWTDAAVAAGSAGGRGGGAFGSHASSGGTSGRILTPAEMLASPIHRPAVEDVAAVLGIDPVSDGEFLIIAAECLAAGQTLPPGWQTAFDEQQQHDYWWNDVTVSQSARVALSSAGNVRCGDSASKCRPNSPF